MRLSVIGSAALALLSGCATVSEPVAPVESPVPKAVQVAAQQTAAAPAAKRYKTKLAILRFSNETNYGRSLLSDADYDRIGKQASDMLASRLVASGKFIVLERPDLRKLEGEQAVSGVAGGLVGSDTVIAGSVTEFGRFTGGKSGFLSNTKVQIARAKVEIRLVDLKTGHAYFSASGAGEANTESGEIAGFGSHADYDATLNDRAIGAAVTDVIDRLVSSLADRPWRTDILDLRDGKVFVAGGKAQGLRVGDALAVMKQGPVVKSKATGFDVPLPPTQIATLQVVSLFGESETTEGAVCDVTSGSIPPSQLPTLFVAEVKP